MNNDWSWLAYSVLLFSLVSCGGKTKAPVDEIGQPPLTAKVYTVVKGDTLFAIAWRFDKEYQDLADLNGLSKPFLIRPGDRVYLDRALKEHHEGIQSSTKTTTYSRPKQPVVKRIAEKASQSEIKRVKQSNSKASIRSKDKHWIWPATGKVTRRFSPQDKLSKGIDISNELGTPIYASKSGQVVYSGSRLKGYGKLIIIRHDDIYLSAYAHNRKVLIKEGDEVVQGQIIAELGQSGTQAPKLHFEIRKYGKPINPLKLLKQ